MEPLSESYLASMAETLKGVHHYDRTVRTDAYIPGDDQGVAEYLAKLASLRDWIHLQEGYTPEMRVYLGFVVAFEIITVKMAKFPRPTPSGGDHGQVLGIV